MPLRAIIMLVLTIAAAATGQNAPPAGGVDVIPHDLSVYQLDGRRVELGKAQVVAVTGQPFAKALRLSTQDGAGLEWDVQLVAPTAAAVKRGDVMLARFWVRCVDSMTGEGQIGVVFERVAPPNDKSVEQTIGAASQWQECFVPFTAHEDFAAGEARACLRLGFDRQTLELADVQVLKYGGDVKLADLPRTKMSYAGRTADAPWRREALERIEKIRKGDLAIRVVDASGNPLAGAEVRATLKRHAFGFGSCVTAELICGTSPDAQKYRQIIEDHFTRVVFENDMKWPPMWNGISPNVDRAVDWLRERNIEIRGHNLHWPSWRWSPQQLKDYEKDPSALRAKCADRVTSTVAHFKGKLIHWDVVNEPYNNRDLLNILGEDVMVDWFKLARQADPACKLYLNDFGIFDGGAGNEHRAHFYKTIGWLKEKGAPIDGIGIQSHFSAALPPPAQLVKVLDQFSGFDLPIESTELSINTTDRELQADYMRDYMIAVFSHPKVEGIMLWGFWQGRHWRPEAGLWATDWSLRPHGQVWLDLVSKQWKTDATVKSDGSGAASVRGFAGDYEITVSSGGKAKTVTAKLPIGGASVTVSME